MMFKIRALLNQDVKKTATKIPRNNVHMNGVHFFIEN